MRPKNEKRGPVSSIAAALLSYYTIAQVDGLLAGKLGVTEAASALQIAVRFPDDGGADEVVAAIGEQILGPTDVSLSNWTVRPSSGCSVVVATHTAGVSVDGYTLTLTANPWNIVRTYNLTPGRELLFACRYRLGTASNFVVYMSEADNVYDPLYGSFAGDEGAWSTAKMYFTAPSGEAALRCALPGAGPAQPDGRNGGRLRPPDPGRNPGGRQHGGGGGGHGGLGAAAEDGYAMTLSAFGWNIDARETLLLRLPVQAGHGLQLGGVRQRGRTTTTCAAGRNRKAALRSLRHVYPRAGAAVGGHAGPVQHADQGLGLRGRVGPAGGLAGPHGLGHAGRAHRAGQRGLRVQRRKLHRRVHHGRGRLGRSLLRSAHSHRHRCRGHAHVHGGRVRQLAEHQRRGQRGPAELRHRNQGSTLTINNTANAGNFTTVGDVSKGTASGAATAASFAATGALMSTGSAVCGDVTSLGTVSAPQLFASNTLIVTNTSDFLDDLFLTKN